MNALDQKTTDQKTTDQQLTDLGDNLRAQLAALYADHLEQLDKYQEQVNQVPVSDLGGLTHALLWKVYKAKRDAAGAAYEAAYFTLLQAERANKPANKASRAK